VALGEEALRGASHDTLLIGGDAELGEGGEIVAEGAGADFDEGEGFAVVADEIEFALDAARRLVAGHENIAVTAEIPVGVGFAADAGAAGGMFVLVGGVVVAQAFARAQWTSWKMAREKRGIAVDGNINTVSLQSATHLQWGGLSSATERTVR
jgi:hypothetical protein